MLPPPFLKNVSEPHAQKCAETSPSVSGSKNNLRLAIKDYIYLYTIFEFGSLGSGSAELFAS